MSFMVDLKGSKPVVTSMSAGRSFHNLDATVEKARSPYDCCLVLGTYNETEVLTGSQGPDWLVFQQKFHETVWRQAVKGLKSEHEDLMLYPLPNGEPVQSLENPGDLLMFLTTRINTSCSVLNSLLLVQKSSRYPTQHCISIVDTRSHQGVNQFLGDILH